MSDNTITESSKRESLESFVDRLTIQTNSQIITNIKSIPDPINTIAVFGRGWDRLRARERGDSVEVSEIVKQLGAPDKPNGQYTIHNLIAITSSSQLRETFSASASASFGFGVFSGGIDMSFLREQKFTELNQYLLARVLVINATYTLKTLKMKKLAVDTFKKSIARGYEAFGDVYVAGLQEGGSLYILLEISSTNLFEKQRLEVQVKAALAANTATGGLEKSFELLKETQRISMKLFRAGSQDASPGASFLDAMEYARTFPYKVRPKDALDENGEGGKPFIIKALTTDYNTTEEMPIPGFGEFLNKPIQSLELIANAIEYITDIRSELQSLMTYPDAYEGLTPAEAQAEIDKANNQIATLNDLAQKCYENPLEFGEWKNDLHPIRKPKLKELLLDSIYLPVPNLGYINFGLLSINGIVRLLEVGKDPKKVRYNPPIKTLNGDKCFKIQIDQGSGSAHFYSRNPRSNQSGLTCMYVEPSPPYVLDDPMKVVGADGQVLAIKLKYHEGRWKFKISNIV